ncbi:MAG: iron uptake porin [Oscillatoriaceae bacterium SKW80]|nr:iron uptake porin [Oscillatoriaceae bacterium SKYG93]MCX8119527.1 iron uptake porin [Oscillatoriaceae bacterium SKW80]MDW8454994.1 iron uptake porin [Oscillatoriaceae cyanobacterium SKYGB_i_bin93]
MRLKYFLLALAALVVTAPTSSAETLEESAKVEALRAFALEKRSPENSQGQIPVAPVSKDIFPETLESSQKNNPTSTEEINPISPFPNREESLEGLDGLGSFSFELGKEDSLENITSETMERVNSVSQLSDVQPTDWAFVALQNLVERYGCIVGYPDSTYRGNRAISRYEFAAGLNACLNRINELIATNQLTADYITKDDLATLDKLQAEYQTELNTIRGRIDLIEARVSSLEAQQFFTKTTTVFGGEVIFAMTGAAGGDPPGKGENNVVFNQLTRLGLVSTFTGKDRLRLELSTGNFSERGFSSFEGFNTDMTLLSYQGGLANKIQLDKLEYRFAAFGDRIVFTFRPVGFSLSSILTANSPYFDAGRGAISRFAEASPLFKIGNLDAGVGFDWLVSDIVRLQFAYGTGNSNIPSKGGGVFGSDRSALGVQLLVKPAANVLTGLAYINAYSSEGRLDTFTGSFNADTSGLLNEPAQIHGISGTLQWRITPKITFATWGGLVFSNSLTSDASATTTTYLLSLGLSDPFGREGDLLAFLVGQPPKLVNGEGVQEDEATSLHLETFYRFRITDNLSISPGFFIVTKPEHNPDNNAIIIGTIRTTFRF